MMKMCGNPTCEFHSLSSCIYTFSRGISFSSLHVKSHLWKLITCYSIMNNLRSMQLKNIRLFNGINNSTLIKVCFFFVSFQHKSTLFLIHSNEETKAIAAKRTLAVLLMTGLYDGNENGIKMIQQDGNWDTLNSFSHDIF